MYHTNYVITYNDESTISYRFSKREKWIWFYYGLKKMIKTNEFRINLSLWNSLQPYVRLF